MITTTPEEYWDKVAKIVNIIYKEQYYGYLIMDIIILALAIYFVRIKRL